MQPSIRLHHARGDSRKLLMPPCQLRVCSSADAPSAPLALDLFQLPRWQGRQRWRLAGEVGLVKELNLAAEELERPSVHREMIERK